MARITKKLFEDMSDAEKEKYIINMVAGHASRSDKISWGRKYDNMQTLLSKVHPIENQIMELKASLLPLYDEIAILRQTMVEECVHPVDQLIVTEDYTECKFCNKKFILK